jgi:hypothetical protein
MLEACLRHDAHTRTRPEDDGEEAQDADARCRRLQYDWIFHHPGGAPSLPKHLEELQ